MGFYWLLGTIEKSHTDIDTQLLQLLNNILIIPLDNLILPDHQRLQIPQFPLSPVAQNNAQSPLRELISGQIQHDNATEQGETLLQEFVIQFVTD